MIGFMSSMKISNILEVNNKKNIKNREIVANGTKITSAQDDSANYSISEKMRTQIRTLNQCEENVDNMKKLMDTASKSVDLQIDIMKKVKELSLKSINGIYNDSDRKIMQIEMENLIDEVDTIAHSTLFNGINLLNKVEVGRIDVSFDTNTPYVPLPSNIPVIPEAAQMPNGKYTVPMGEYNNINMYDPGAVGLAYTAMPTPGDWVMDSSGNAHVVVKDSTTGILHLNDINNTVIEVNGLSNNGLPVGTSTNVYNLVPVSNPNIGDQVLVLPQNTVFPIVAEPGTLQPKYFIPGGNKSIIEFDFSQLVAGRNIPQDLDRLGFSLNCGGCKQFVTIQFTAKTDDTKVYGADPNSDTEDPFCYVVGIKSVTDADSLQQAVFNGLLSASGHGTGYLPSTNDETARVAARHDINLNYNQANNKITISKDGPTITMLNGIRGELIEDVYFKPQQQLALQNGIDSALYSNMKISNTTKDILFPSYQFKWDIDLKDDDYPDSWPEGYDWNFDKNRAMTDAEKKEKWKSEVWQYPDKKVGELSILTKDTAKNANDAIDQALKYLINANTKIGAQIQGIDYMKSNIVTTAENITASESNIRDANMAKAILDETKTSVLGQVAEAMLAQSNSNFSSVLSLLK